MIFRGSTAIRSAFLGVILVAFLGGCSSKEVRYPEDHARFERIVAAVENLRQAYVDKDMDGVGDLLLPLEPLERLKQEIRKDFRTFQRIDLDLSIERIMIQNDMIDVYVHWQGTWHRLKQDSGFEERGHGVLRWGGVQYIILNGIEGDLPFGMASQHAAAEHTSAGEAPVER